MYVCEYVRVYLFFWSLLDEGSKLKWPTKMTKLTLLIWCPFYYPTLIKNHFKLTMVFFMNRLTISLSWKYFSQFTRKKKSRNGLVVRVNTSKISGAYKTSHKHLSNVDQLISSNKYLLKNSILPQATSP